MQGRHLLTAWAALLLLAQVCSRKARLRKPIRAARSARSCLMPPAAPPTRSRAWRATSSRRSWASRSSSTAGPAPTASSGRRRPPAPRPTAIPSSSSTTRRPRSTSRSIRSCPITRSDFAPLTRAGSFAMVLVVNPAVPAASVEELLAWARAGKEINFGSGGVGSAQHVLMEMFISATGLRLTHVPYRGVIPAMNDVVAGHIPMMVVGLAGSLGAIRSGLLRPIAMTGAKRAAELPDVPAFRREADGPDFSHPLVGYNPTCVGKPAGDAVLGLSVRGVALDLHHRNGVCGPVSARAVACALPAQHCEPADCSGFPRLPALRGARRHAVPLQRAARDRVGGRVRERDLQAAGRTRFERRLAEGHDQLAPQSLQRPRCDAGGRERRVPLVHRREARSRRTRDRSAAWSAHSLAHAGRARPDHPASGHRRARRCPGHARDRQGRLARQGVQADHQENSADAKQ